MRSYESEFKGVISGVRSHEKWFSESLPMIASENLASEPVRRVLSSDLGHRYAEGWPGERVYAGCKYIDQIELQAITLGKKLFKAEHVDVRPVSGVNANLAVYSALSGPGDMMMALSIPNGGHISHGKKDFGGTAGMVHSLEVSYFAFDKDAMNIDIDETKKRIAALPSLKLAMFGCSLFLFPHPVKELAQAIHDKGGTVCYDAAHVAGLIAGGQFQDPLREGAQVMTMSTHKVLFGPQGGAIASTAELAEPLKKAVFPGTSSNHHLHNVAAKAMVFAEFLQFGRKYAKDVVTNAQTLAERLAELGELVLGEKNGYTMSHQVALDVTKYSDGGVIEKVLEDQNIICNREPIPGDLQAGRHYTNPGGIRLGVSELTRLGMGKSDMKEVAELVHLAIGGTKKREVLSRIKNLRKEYQNVKYSFSDTPAYSFT
ncbi:MAG: serine hydroxymethyltransferase [Nitrososphaerota archaeon]|jgi:glycine hydroxymethyltransferase|nr:serine hydroxymethyltransferase [Nitrososphaerota archaeon]MDG6942986.1 serine hydroxymethyltransferase [Nitrososphaerota archaeon]MDG6950714.1 serine hydroxymethyltransferase [Nitrososphaerota archaeon]